MRAPARARRQGGARRSTPATRRGSGATFGALIEHIHATGERLADDELEPSDLMLPPPDITLEEARKEFSGEGLIPD